MDGSVVGISPVATENYDEEQTKGTPRQVFGLCRTKSFKMKLIATGLLLSLGIFAIHAGERDGKVENDSIAWRWQLAGGKLQPVQVEDKINGGTLVLTGDYFRLVLGDGSVLKSSDFKPEGSPILEKLKPEPNSPTAARHCAGQQLVAKLSAPKKNLSVEWRVILRDGSTYLRQELTLRAKGKDVLVKEIALFEQKVPGAKTVGTVDGSPVVADPFFFGYEHPMAHNTVKADEVSCSFVRNAVLKDGEVLTQSAVIGVVPRGQLRRGFLAYIERERAHPYRPFLHYNSWFDIAWDTRKFNEAESLDAIGSSRTSPDKEKALNR